VSSQNTTAGDTLFLAIRDNASVTISDSQNNVWEPTGVNLASGLWYTSNIPGGAETITISYPTEEYFQVVCAEYSGQFHLDRGGNLASGTGTSATSYSLTTISSGDLILGFGNNNSANNSGVHPTAGSGFTMRAQVDEFLEDLTQTSAGTVSTSATYNASTGWEQGIAAFAPGPAVPGSLIQAGAVNQPTGSAETYSCPFSSPNLAGDTLVLSARIAASVTITDTQGNTWNSIATNSSTGLWYATNVKAGANHITITYAANHLFQGACVEYSGALHPDVFSTIASGTGTAATSASVTTTSPGDLVIGYGYNSTSNIEGLTPESGFAYRSAACVFIEDEIQPATGSVDGSVTYSSSVNWYQGVAAFTAAPIVTALSPNVGAVGASVTITGNDFGSSQGSGTVTFGGVSATPTSWTSSSITVPVPSGAATGNVVVTVSSLPSNGVNFTVPPAIIGLSTSVGAIQQSIMVSGSGFGPSEGPSTITFNGVSASPTAWSATSITVPVPVGASSGNIVVTVGGYASNPASFVVAVPPTISASVSPSPNAQGWYTSFATVTFTCTAGSAQITSCTPPQVVTTQGQNQVVTGTVTDANGFSLSASATVSLELVQPAVTVTTPTDQTTVSSSSVSVSGSVSGSLTAVSNITCNGTVVPVTSGAFSCNISLNPGVNLLMINATDAAGNLAGARLHVIYPATLAAPMSLSVTPANANVLIGGTQQFTAVDDLGRPRPDATWTVSDATIATISTDTSPILTGVAAGQVTLTASFGSMTAQSQVTVLAGSALPIGTALWTAPAAPGYTTHQLLQAQPTANGTPALLSVEFAAAGGPTILIRGFTADGQQTWQTSPSVYEMQGFKVTPDNTGGAVHLWCRSK
jgi:hypothetical protein